MTNKIIKKLQSGTINKSELVQLLKARGQLQKDLFQQAKQIRKKYFQNKAFVRGVIEISNYCRKNCDYCAIRRSNKTLKRYRMTPTQIFTIAKQVAALGIKTLFLQAGEDPSVDDIINEAVSQIRKKLKIDNIILCLGNRSKNQYKKFKRAGINAYILKFETSDRKRYEKMRHEPLSKRLACLNYLTAVKIAIGTGNIIGLPQQTLKSIVNDIFLAKKLKPAFISAAPFIHNERTPLEDQPCGDLNLTLNVMAIERIILKKVLIPTVSALEKLKRDGQLLGFNAGANVITINFTPPQYRKKYLLYSRKRFFVSLNHAIKTIKSAGLIPDISKHL